MIGSGIDKALLQIAISSQTAPVVAAAATCEMCGTFHVCDVMEHRGLSLWGPFFWFCDGVCFEAWKNLQAVTQDEK